MADRSQPVVRFHTVVASPVGELTLVGDGHRLTGLYMTDQRWLPPLPPGSVPDRTPFASVIDQLSEYFSGQRTEFDVPLAPVGTPFQLAVWEALRSIPYGTTTSYGQLARSVNSPGASRAVGAANGRNPISIIVPCHRVIGSSGDLTGYGGGLPRKRQLLDLEQGRVQLRYDTANQTG